MTVQTQFFNYQAAPYNDPDRCSPMLLSIRDYLRNKWGGMDLGCYGERPVRGGTSVSSHAFGSAQDWRYSNPGPGRTTLINEVLPFLLNNSKEIGVQAVHDYVGNRVWRPPGTSGRPPGGIQNGWQDQGSAGSGMGESWATWIHIEVHPSMWHETDSVAELVNVAPPPPPKPVWNPATGHWPGMPAKNKGTKHWGDEDRQVEYFQGVSNLRLPNFCKVFAEKADDRFEETGNKKYAAVADRLRKCARVCRRLDVDKQYGNQTAEAVYWIKRAFNYRRLPGGHVLRFDVAPNMGNVFGAEVWKLIDALQDSRW